MIEWTTAQILATTVIKITTSSWAKGHNAMASLKKPKFLQSTIGFVTWPNYYSHPISKKPCGRIDQVQKLPIILLDLVRRKLSGYSFRYQVGEMAAGENRQNTGTVQDRTDSQRKAPKWCIESRADMKRDGDL